MITLDSGCLDLVEPYTVIENYTNKQTNVEPKIKP